MNIYNKLRRREHGLANERTYDFALRRLCVSKEDSWRGIAPANYSPDFNPEPPIFSAKFANCDGYRHILAIANEDGKIALQDTTLRNQEPEEQSLSAPQCHFNAVFDLEWAPGQMRFVSASGDHTARLWDVAGSGIRGLNSYVGHTRSVKSAAFKRTDPAVFATGGRDGAILIWDIRANLNMDLTSRIDNCIYSGHAGGPGTPISQRKQRTRTPKTVANTTSSSITGLAFQDNDTLISCGAGDGIIKVWDLRRNYTAYKKEPLPRHSLPYAGNSTFKGFTNLIVDAAGARLYANCMDNTIYCYNLMSYSPKPLACYKGLLNSTFYIKSCLSPDGKYLLSGSSDERAYIWNLEHADEPLVALSGHTVEVTCVAWGATHDRPLVTCSDDARHKIWRIGPDNVTDAERAENYRGHAAYVRQFDRKPASAGAATHKYNLRALESTPRSLKRLMEQNERTPGSVEKMSMKRSFLDMLGAAASTSNDADPEHQQQKRPKMLESRGRRLFGPTTNPQEPSCRHIQLPAIAEDDPLPLRAPEERSSDMTCNQENTIEEVSPLSSSSSKAYSVANMPSPLSENINHIYTSPPTTSAAAASAYSSASSPLGQSLLLSSNGIYSPTSNLPNYVLDGEAPHLGIMSPKRKAKEKVDWLTKIRKQKLMTSVRAPLSLSEKINEEQQSCVTADVLASPRLKSLRNSECSPRLQATPRRRTSHNDGTGGSGTPRTPTSSRRNSETTLLRFFSVQRTNVIRETVEVDVDGSANIGVDDVPPLSPSPPTAPPLTTHTPTTTTVGN
ncbi:protein lethal(2)denticleless [Scaptodrosophila lebanonensis]|uniref:Protein lethal(2)denticleless n=1 Tax=Drosophila lebanonensis TaxID=7225 RepID=A0A6J2SX53_DROLE|nr:protein lethal(2)denticleless [Scaptodrosophila lebanonensis]